MAIDEKKLKYEIMTNLHKEKFQDYKTGAKGIYYLSDDLYSLIDNLPKIGEWIPCSEKLPEFGAERFLVCLQNGGIFMAAFLGEFMEISALGMRKFYKDNPVIAWQPLPLLFKP